MFSVDTYLIWFDSRLRGCREVALLGLLLRLRVDILMVANPSGLLLFVGGVQVQDI